MRRNDIVCFIPLAGVVLLLEVPFWVVGRLTASAPNETLIVIALGALGAVLLAGAGVMLGFLVHILRRKDFDAGQKAAWIAILFAAGPVRAADLLVRRSRGRSRADREVGQGRFDQRADRAPRRARWRCRPCRRGASRRPGR